MTAPAAAARVGTGVSAARAAEVAADRSDKVTAFVAVESRGTKASGKCAWQLVTISGLAIDERAAVAWLVADRLMRSRCGRAAAYSKWRDSVLTGLPLTGRDRDQVIAFTRDVFGMPDSPGSFDHLEGHVGEWLWYLLMSEREDPDRRIALLEPPKFSVTEPGPDGFVVYEVDGQPLLFRLWELKKHTGASGLSGTTREAYEQLGEQGDRYLAQLTAMHADKTGNLGQICAELVDLWVDADRRAGAGVGVTSAKLPAPARCFTTMGKHLPRFAEPGQLEALLCAVQDYHDVAADVRRFVWTAL
ncbi:MAG TPA: hypothetical protein VHB69_02795 [Mycobacteriales bacterium]|nr:hypothetical protein [Mycobacteriales bacterium]